MELRMRVDYDSQETIYRSSSTNTKKTLFNQLKDKEVPIAVLGLGYVGLPVALHMAQKFSVVAYDINKEKVRHYLSRQDPSGEISSAEFENKDICFYSSGSAISKAKFYIIAVPTPINSDCKPNLNALKAATKTVAVYLKKGDYVVYESTVYPGCTEEECIPLLEKYSGLELNRDFFVGYSPERINPGDKKHTFSTITKIVSGSTPEALDIISKVYREVVDAGIHEAPSIKVAEAAKIVENTQRDVNIALMNELSCIFERLGVNVHDVLEAAGTKWNFLKFYPGFVGGHCIGVDPYYLIDQSLKNGFEPKLIQSARGVNELMAPFLAGRIMVKLFRLGKNASNINVLVKGITFKENVRDIRNSKVFNFIERLKTFQVNVFVEDPYADPEEVFEEFGIELIDPQNDSQQYDAVIMAVNHDSYDELCKDDMEQVMTDEGFLFDVRAKYSHLVSADRYEVI